MFESRTNGQRIFPRYTNLPGVSLRIASLSSTFSKGSLRYGFLFRRNTSRGLDVHQQIQKRTGWVDHKVRVVLCCVGRS